MQTNQATKPASKPYFPYLITPTDTEHYISLYKGLLEYTNKNQRMAEVIQYPRLLLAYCEVGARLEGNEHATSNKPVFTYCWAGNITMAATRRYPPALAYVPHIYLSLKHSIETMQELTQHTINLLQEHLAHVTASSNTAAKH